MDYLHKLRSWSGKRTLKTLSRGTGSKPYSPPYQIYRQYDHITWYRLGKDHEAVAASMIILHKAKLTKMSAYLVSVSYCNSESQLPFVDTVIYKLPNNVGSQCFNFLVTHERSNLTIFKFCNSIFSGMSVMIFCIVPLPIQIFPPPSPPDRMSSSGPGNTVLMLNQICS
jgi:hypothetical protein